MSDIQIKDKSFTTFITEDKILKEVSRVADEINRDLAGTEPLFLSVLNGSFMFTADLMKRINIPCEISFVKLASYQGTSSTGKIKELVGLNENIEGRTVVIVEDIVDTGFTMKGLVETLRSKNPKDIRIATLLVKPDKLKGLVETLRSKNPKDIRIATLLVKPDKLQVKLDIDYVAMNIPNDFIVGYGLDYDGKGRNYRDIYTVVNE